MVGSRTRTERSDCWYGPAQHEAVDTDVDGAWSPYGEPQHDDECVRVPPSRFTRLIAAEIGVVDPSTLDAFSPRSLEVAQHG